MDRTLPRPTSLLSEEELDAYIRRSSSLLRHHIASDQFLSPAVEESGVASSIQANTEDRTLTYSNDDLNKPIQSFDTAVSDMSSSVPSKSPSPESSELVEAKNGYCLCQPEPKIPRPRNAFILYRQHQHPAVVARNPGLPNPDISKIIGEQWRQLPLEKKDEWKALAEQEKTRHSQQFPDYRYRPRRNGRPSIQSEALSSSIINASGFCLKCGGKTMNPPYTPHYTTFPPVSHTMPPMMTVQGSLKRSHAESNSQPPPLRPQNITTVATSPQRTAVRYAFSPQQPHLVQYGSPCYHTAASQLSRSAHAEMYESKRRRYNDSASQGSHRNVFIDPEYDYVSRESGYVYPERTTVRSPQALMLHQTRPAYVSPLPRTAQIQDPPTQQQKQDSSLTLPPLRSAVAKVPRPVMSSSSSTQSSGIEAMIMSYPVLTKLKTLSTITPAFSALEHEKSGTCTHGAIIAVEGMDSACVHSMARSLSKQLEKGGKFAVKIFDGPDPYMAHDPNLRAGDAEEGTAMTTEQYLSMIKEWHNISKEMVKYVTTKPDLQEQLVLEEREQDKHMTDVSTASQIDNGIGKGEESSSIALRSPISVMSPKTIVQTASLSLNTPTRMDSSTYNQDHAPVLPTPKSSRVPLVALEARKRASEKQQQRRESYVDSVSLARVETISTTPLLQSDQDLKGTTVDNSLRAERIPIALIPHYQLTTVDTCAITLPITDNYDPVTHWRWHATLWRGCVGADVTVVIKSPHEQYEDEDTPISEPGAAKNSSGGPTGSGAINPAASQQATSFGVEVRLQDYRAVIVRSGTSGPRCSIGRGDENELVENENWEKAKRRVGFEVEEFLRK